MIKKLYALVLNLSPILLKSCHVSTSCSLSDLILSISFGVQLWTVLVAHTFFAVPTTPIPSRRHGGFPSLGPRLSLRQISLQRSRRLLESPSAVDSGAFEILLTLMTDLPTWAFSPWEWKGGCSRHPAASHLSGPLRPNVDLNVLFNFPHLQ